ncbi:MAG: hypothetical protein SA378_11400 [Sedimentibacter sp.]|uniref:hypothetical protein n=1 Tax=Sedimentibacter sp. TaxID=1960295 RepID=UPI0029810B71|nr:hypothetical protein [Sedimentibacter sp.]MDW5300720.1 hypothetical protein [Sedimentibacter sp.]
MGSKFKWDMFVTSFIPLWFSIIVINIWNIIENCSNDWKREISLWDNICILSKANYFFLVSIFIIFLLVFFSMISISIFLKDKKRSENKPTGTIIKARRANKLSSEFLLAYILPMIAFDFSDLQDIALFLIYFSVLATLCIRNNNVYTNIYLEFKGYRMYTCDIECSVLDKNHIYFDSLIISLYDLTTMIDKEIQYWDFENYIYINLNEKEE